MAYDTSPIPNGYGSLPIQTRTGNPYLDEIDQAAGNAHASLSPGAQEALKRAGAPVGIQAQQQPQGITNPIKSPPTLGPPAASPAMPEAQPSAQPLASSVSTAPTTGIVAPHQQVQPVPQTAAAGPAQAEMTRLAGSKAGVDQIHNPWGRIPLQVLAGIGETFSPRLAQALPGTWSHHNMLLGQAENAVEQQQGIRKSEEEARAEATKTGLEEAQTEALGAESKKNTVTLGPGQGIFDLKTNTWLVDPTVLDNEKVTEVRPDIAANLGIMPTKDGKFLVPNQALGSLLKPKSETSPKTLIEKAMADHPEWSADDLQQFLAKQPKETQLSADDVGILKKVGGDPRVDIRDQPVPIIDKFLAEKRRQSAPQVDRGQNFIDPSTNRMVRVEPGGSVPTGALTAQGLNRENATPTQMLNREGQARIIRSAGDQLVSSIERNRGKLGNLGSYWTQATNGTPIADPDTAGLMAQLSSFAALQPTLHGFRSEAALKGFEHIIGGVPKNPDALISAIRAIQGTAEIIEGGGGRANQPAGGGIPEVKTQAEFDALPKGARYTEDGKPFTKP